jgi:hypothetical protein
MSGVHVRYFYFTLTVAAALFGARGHDQSATERRTIPYPYSLSAVDQSSPTDRA